MNCFYLIQPTWDGWFFEDAPTSTMCPDCDCVVDHSWRPESISVRNRPRGFGVTQDHQSMCSIEAKRALEKKCSTKIEFELLNDRKKLYAYKPLEVVSFDLELRKVKMQFPCENCGQYREVIGPHPLYLKEPENLDANAMYQLDIIFGSGRRKGVAIIVGESLKGFLQENFKELYFKPTFSRDNPFIKK